MDILRAKKLRQFCKSCCRIECADHNVDVLRPSRIYDHTIVSGSGFLVSSQDVESAWKWNRKYSALNYRYIITNFHVVDGCLSPQNVLVYFESFGKHGFPGTVVRAFPQVDLAVIAIENVDALTSLVNLPLMSTHVPNFTRIYALGYPNGQSDVQMSEGVISGWDDEHLQMNISINHGNSGGPMVACCSDGELRVAGVNVATAEGSEGIAFAIPLQFLKLYQMCAHRSGVKRTICFFPETVCRTRCRYILDEHPSDLLMVMGFKAGDAILMLCGEEVDLYGEMEVSWKNSAHWSDRHIMYSMVSKGGSARVKRGGAFRTIKWPPLPSISRPMVHFVFPTYEDIQEIEVGSLTLTNVSMNTVISACESQGFSNPLAHYMTSPIDQHVPCIIVSNVDVSSATRSGGLICTYDVVSHVNGSCVMSICDIKNMSKIESLTFNDTFTIAASKLV